MQELLRQNNIALLHEIEQLQRGLIDAQEKVPEELRAYMKRITSECDLLYQRVLDNLKYLEFGLEDLLRDILSETELVTRAFYELNGQRASPILRARASDRLSLKFLLWLHATHPQAKNIPAAICDGEFGVLPIQPTLYATPCTSQKGLRTLPIFFHEFGHLLYTFHQSEMNDLINELQAEIRDLLRPPVERNDQFSQTQERSRNVIVDTWYEWTQECFCDAVGLVMGGPSFAYTFSKCISGHSDGTNITYPEENSLIEATPLLGSAFICLLIAPDRWITTLSPLIWKKNGVRLPPRSELLKITTVFMTGHFFR